METLVDSFRVETAIPAEFVSSGDQRPMPPMTEECLLRVAQEALTNVRRHASASRVDVTLSYLDDQIVLGVQDTGVGFEPASLARTEGWEGGVGLNAMGERVEEQGGMRRVESARGEGTTIIVELPLPRFSDTDTAAAQDAS